MKEPIFTGAGVAIITPMNDDTTINYDAFAKMIDFQIENGTDAIVVVGTTGEASTLNTTEHREAIKFTVDYVNNRVPVIAGCGSNNTAYGIETARAACNYNADALLVVTPYYNKTTQKGLISNYRMFHDATNKPIIMYSVPSRTGVNIEPETCAELAKLPRINGIKEASGNISQVMKIRALCGDELNIWSGNDDQIPAVMSCGGKGVISVLANILPKETHEITQLCLENKFDEATKLAFKYLPLAHALFNDVNPIPVKEALNIMGFKAGECRMPLIRSEEAKIEELRKALDDLGLVGCIK